MGKNIAVLSSPWSDEHIGGILAGMKKKTMESGTDLYIFNCYGGREGGNEYNSGEYQIFELPDFKMFDGVLVLCNDVAALQFMGGTFQKIKESGIPCICLDQEIEGFRFVGTDNYTAMYDMVEHLITVHNCRKLNYVGGPADHSENALRRQAYCDVLERHKIPVEEERIREYSFVKEDGKRAFYDFRRLGTADADAVVCANDDMAAGYVDELLDAGYRVPEDVRVTGFDFGTYGRNYFPEIASVERSREDLGYAAVEHMLELLDGKDVPLRIFAPHHLRPNTSCGCKPEIEEYRKVRRKKIETDQWSGQSRWAVNCMQKGLLICEDEEKFRGVLSAGLYAFGIHNFAMLINDTTYDKEYDFLEEREPQTGYPEQMRVLFWNKRPDLAGDNKISTSDLLPAGFLNEEQDYHFTVFSPIHLRGIGFGYCVMEDGLKHIKDGNLYYLMGVLDVSLENVRQNTYIRKINRKLNRMYMLDAMTGVYNRFALNTYGVPLLKKNIEEGHGTLLLFADMDGLKVFNDTYGHDMGDSAIRCLADIMKESCPDETYFCIRYGGDEFLIMGTCDTIEAAEKLQAAINGRMQAFNEEGKLPGKLSASFGYVLADAGDADSRLDDYISKADEMMYHIKKEKKKRLFETKP